MPLFTFFGPIWDHFTIVCLFGLFEARFWPIWCHFQIFPGPFWPVIGLYGATYDLFWACMEPFLPVSGLFGAISCPFRVLFEVIGVVLTCFVPLWSHFVLVMAYLEPFGRDWPNRYSGHIGMFWPHLGPTCILVILACFQPI